MYRMIRKAFSKLLSYKFWSFTAAVVTVLMAVPVIKEYMKGNPEIEVTVGGYIVNKNDEINLYYVIPSLNVNKYQVPFPSFRWWVV